jgi:sortase (surface protein transpeptidase)
VQRTVVDPTWWRSWWPVVLQLAALTLVVTSGAAVIDHRKAAAALAAAADAGAGRSVALQHRAAHAAAPVSVAVPKLGVRSRLVDLRTDPRGALQPPSDPQQAGWYVGSSHPGDPGPTVLAGHVDSRSGPGVFYHLDRLRPGDSIVVGRADRTAVRFVVTRVLRVSKQHFPTALVYLGTRSPSLRLISCGGSFDRSTGHYRDNVIVLASPARPKASTDSQRVPRPSQALGLAPAG